MSAWAMIALGLTIGLGTLMVLGLAYALIEAPSDISPREKASR